MTLHKVNFRNAISNLKNQTISTKKEKKNSDSLSLCSLCLCNNIKALIINWIINAIINNIIMTTRISPRISKHLDAQKSLDNFESVNSLSNKNVHWTS